MGVQVCAYLDGRQVIDAMARAIADLRTGDERLRDPFRIRTSQCA